MIDTGSSDTFMNLAVAQKRKLLIFKKNRVIPLADKKHVATITGEVIVDIELNGRLHKNVVVELVKDLCTEVIIGRDVLRKHKRVVLNFNGPDDDLVIGAIPSETQTSLPNSTPTTTDNNTSDTNNPSEHQQQIGTNPRQKLRHRLKHFQQQRRQQQPLQQSQSETFGAMNIPPPPLFTHLTKDIKPVATKSRRQSPAELAFMREEVKRLASCGIIRPSVSPWRAQAFVTKEDGAHKRRMVIDYSDTINLYTELDAYPMPNVLKMVEEISQYK